MSEQTAPLPAVPGFELLAQLGAGSMGRVFEARDLRMGRTVALKLLNGPRDQRTLGRFQREISATAKLEHPNIVRVYSSGETPEGVPYYVMERVQGPSLAALGATLEPRSVAHLVARIARGLDYAHQRGVIHRDVKPANVIIDEAGEPRLLDFGLAHLLGYPTLTPDGLILGCPGYMAPEVALGEVSRAEGIDIYSLGAVMYHLLAGRPPLEGVGSLPALLAALSQPTPVPGSLASVPPELERVCLRAMARSPQDRYASCAALAEDLEGWLGLPSGAGRWRPWLLVAGAGLLVAALLAWLAGLV